jgi:hypothetical protein
VTIGNVDLLQSDPPYTLYRISLKADSTPQRTVLIENVRSMRFTYYDRAGNQIPEPGGADNLAGLRGRAAIRRVGVEIEALTRDPDLQWSDPDDTDPDTRAFRKFKLSGDVTPRNLGLSGIKDYQADTSPPSMPEVPQLYPGHCGGLYVSWPPSPAQDETAYYRIRYGTDPSDLDGQRAVDGTEYYVGDLSDSQRYYVAIQAVDGSGNLSILGPSADVVTDNTNTPESPLNLAVSDGEDERIELAWDAVTQNTASTLGDPESPLIRELEGYRVYRSSSSGFSPSSSNRIADQDDLPAVPSPQFVDTTGVNCRQYYYRVSAVDRCGREGDRSSEGQGKTFSDDLPAAPKNVEAFLHLADQRRIRWDRVSRDVDDDRIYIEDYYLYRSGLVGEFDLPPLPQTFSFVTEVKGATEYIDSPPLLADHTVWYAVRAKDDCPNVSGFSETAVPECWFDGHVEIDTPADGEVVTGSAPIEVRVHDGGASYTELRLTIREKVGTYELNQTFGSPGPGNLWTLTWDTAGLTPGEFFVYAEVDQDNSGHFCEDATSIQVTVGP